MVDCVVTPLVKATCVHCAIRTFGTIINQSKQLSQVFDRVIVWISGVVTFTSSNDANLRSDGA